MGQLGRLRPIWGNNVVQLQKVRNPWKVSFRLGWDGVPCPAVLGKSDYVQFGRWLSKPLAGTGGRGIVFGMRQPQEQASGVYFQEYIEGESCAALYLGDGRTAHLLGVTRQLVGEDWLSAEPFHYCGSIGPLNSEPVLLHAYERLGAVLVQQFHLRGLFGVDCVERDGIPYPVEVNPRYTASVEVLEYATGLRALALHRRVFDPTAPAPPDPEPATDYVGKAILFARDDVTVPGDGPWSSELEHPTSVFELPLFADIPPDGQRVPKGKPILTFFARASSMASCRDTLKQIAADLDRWLFGR
jgi:predicted ATP-grasp superfamily ATP-dependent carboligase